MIDQETLNTFDKLYDNSYDSVLKYVVCHCSNIEDVKDIVQNIYLELLKILSKNKSFHQDTAYILGIAKNKVNEYYRFHYKNKLISLFSKKDDFSILDNIPDHIDIQKEVIQKEDLKLIWDYLKKKNVIISKVFYLYYYADMNIKNIVQVLHISESNVKHYLYRTLKELNSMMNRSDENVK